MGLKYLYKGFYFSKISESYMDYGAWSESLIAAGGLPADESIELFLDFLNKEGIELDYYNLRNPILYYRLLSCKYFKKESDDNKKIKYDIYDGYILTHFEDENEIREILQKVTQGKKLIFLRYNPLVPSSSRGLEQPKEIFNDVFLKELKIELKTFEKGIIVQDHGYGTIVCVDGSIISDEKLDVWEYPIARKRDSTKNVPYQFIISVINALKKYSIPYFVIDIQNPPPKAWLVDENFFISINVFNIGPTAVSVYISLNIEDDNIDPQTSNELYFNLFEKNHNKSLSFLLKNNAPGIYKNFLNFKILYKYDEHFFEKSVPIQSETQFISPQIAIKENESILGLNAITTKYQDLQDKLKGIDDFEEIIKSVKSMENNPRGTISNARTLLEFLIKKIYKKNIGSYGKLNLDACIDGLKNAKIINKKVYTLTTTVRRLVNWLIHPQKEKIIKVTPEDALLIANMLFNILDELLKLKLI